VTALLGYAPNDRVVIALAGMGKVFVGELVEEGAGLMRILALKSPGQVSFLSPGCSAHMPLLFPIPPTARIIASLEGHNDALLPSHIRRAYQNLSFKRVIPRRLPAKRLIK